GVVYSVLRRPGRAPVVFCGSRSARGGGPRGIPVVAEARWRDQRESRWSARAGDGFVRLAVRDVERNAVGGVRQSGDGSPPRYNYARHVGRSAELLHDLVSGQSISRQAEEAEVM